MVFVLGTPGTLGCVGDAPHSVVIRGHFAVGTLSSLQGSGLMMPVSISGCWGAQRGWRDSKAFLIRSPLQQLQRWEEEKEERGVGAQQSLPAPSLLILPELFASRAEDTRGSAMIPASDSILSSASSALEPDGSVPEVSTLCSDPQCPHVLPRGC